ncbi:hypothetical protein F2P56_008080 [Juglans regia]|uniref:Wound-induced protein 1 n=2 Tax=Juglans regia TaxID=51240 RepID=A0A833Y2R4_JUGRE|nr:wound-induced protein 1-like [Juglans regia]KAF5476354.1 hypothetical protein F2P56_008080 [Juglans regia]
MEACNINVESPDSPNPEMKKNKEIVEALYKALGDGETETVAGLVASDLDWWFHGPPERQHMRRVLTGESGYDEFAFEPRSVTPIGEDCVIVEGWEGAQAYWVHVWNVKEGVITRFREYFNTWLTVKDLRPCWEVGHEVTNDTSTIWQSQPQDLHHRSFPGLMLAI